jgi:4-hydroxybenzoate polyprenyltransferase
MTPSDHDIPLCIDLDGTLLRSDAGAESALALLKCNPLYGFAMLAWLLHGLAYAKRRIAERVALDAGALPFDERLLNWTRSEAGKRRRLLVTASDALLAQPIADRLGLFDGVIASDGKHNLKGHAKAAVLVERFGERGFDYAGNARSDLAVWRHARRAIVVNAGDELAAAAAEVCEVERHFPREAGGTRDWLRALRPHQWLKNLLVFLPLLAAHRWHDAGAIGAAVLAWLAFSLCASGTYIANDLLDLGADRRHPRKRNRPFASGALPLWQGMLASPLLVAAAFVLAVWQLPAAFAPWLAGYLVLTLAYSLAMKRVPMLDVLALAALYTVRILAGGAAAAVPVSFWLLAFSMFLFLSLAMLKRYTELHDLRAQGGGAASGRGYAVDDLPLVQSLGAGCGLVSVLVLALYVDSTTGGALYHHPHRLWLLCPLLLYWIGHVWLLGQRGRMHDDPLVFAARDALSWTLALIAILVVWSAL